MDRDTHKILMDALENINDNDIEVLLNQYQANPMIKDYGNNSNFKINDLESIGNPYETCIPCIRTIIDYGGMCIIEIIGAILAMIAFSVWGLFLLTILLLTSPIWLPIAILIGILFSISFYVTIRYTCLWD